MPFNHVPAGAASLSRDVPPGHPRIADFDTMAAGAHRRMTIVVHSHPLRAAAEACIRDVYERVFSARDLLLPRTLIAWVGDDGLPLCAAGLRSAMDGFFSEVYLDAPIERVLAERTGRPVVRDSIFEVTTLVSRRPDVVSAFLRQIAVFGRNAGFGWSFFTATAGLRNLLGGLGIPAFDLAPADPRRLSDSERWGSYYAHAPQVCAVGDEWLRSGDARRRFAPNA